MDKNLVEELKELLGEDNIYYNEPMSQHTTFRVGGPAELLIMPKADHIADVVRLCRQFGVPLLCVGNGSNMLVSDEGIEGVVMVIGRNMANITVDNETITAEAGAMLGRVAREAYEASLKGMEFASGIPGSIGGACVMNAGAYGGEMKDIIESVNVITPLGEMLTLSNEELDLSYRHSVIPEKDYIVISTVLSLEKGDKEEIKAMMDDFNGRRRDKQPLEYPSAGSTFKRPTGYFAGKLIEDAGLKGYRVGGAEVSTKHCGFVINKDNATATDIYTLIKDVDRIVTERFGVSLEPEVKLVGRFE